jgi:hypothetical protein
MLGGFDGEEALDNGIDVEFALGGIFRATDDLVPGPPRRAESLE